jgi:hypothetical protein
MITANGFYGHAKRNNGTDDAAVSVKRSRATANRAGTDDGSIIGYTLRVRPASLANPDVATAAMRGVDGSIAIPATGVSVRGLTLTGAAARSAVTALLELDDAYIAPPAADDDDGTDDADDALANGAAAE